MYRIFPALAFAVLALVGCGTTTNASGAAVACVNGACAAGQSCVNGYCVVSQLTDTVGGQDVATATGATFIGTCESAKCASQIGLCAGGCATWLTCAQKCLKTDVACQTACAQKAAGDSAASASIQAILQCVGNQASACEADVVAGDVNDVGADVDAGKKDTGDVGADVDAGGEPVSQIPAFILKDINPGSPGYGKAQSLKSFIGKRFILAMLAGWSAAAIATADVVKSSLSQLPGAVIADAVQPELLFPHVGAMPVFVDEWAKISFAVSDGKHAADKNDVLAYDVDGRLLGWFQGAGTIYTNALGDFLNAVIAAPQSPTYFVFCATGGQNGCKVTQ